MDEVEEIKRRIDIVDLISHYLTLKKAGANYKAACPFHQEKTPSLMVSGEKQIFKCFGCNEGGDVFSFIMKMENLEFREALEMLAEQAGVKLKKYQPAPGEENLKDRKTRLYKINDLSNKVFQKLLVGHSAGKEALNYLLKRKLTRETISSFEIGYAASSEILRKFLIGRGFKAAEIQEAGSPDRFFRRIIFPIRDPMGRTIAFTGRVIEKDKEPKYLNTADTIIFHKGQVLFNLDLAKMAIKEANAAILVEGQMDVIASFQAGVKNVVATSGTALTEEHLKIIYRFTPNLIFAFDNDTAGLKTTKKAVMMAIAAGLNAKMVLLGRFKDPGEMIAEKPALWQEAVNNSLSVIEWYLDLAFENQVKAKGPDLSSVEKKEIAKEILPLIKIMPDQIEQAHYVSLLAQKLAINEEVIFEVLKRTQQPATPKPTPVKKETITSQTLLLGLITKEPARLEKGQKVIKEKDFSDPDEAKIYNAYLKEYNKGTFKSPQDLKKLISSFDRGLKNKVSELILAVEHLSEKDRVKEEADFQALLTNLAAHEREDLKAHYAAEIKKAESAHDIAKLKILMKEFQDALSK